MEGKERQPLLGEGQVTLEVQNPRELKREAKYKRSEVVSLQHSYPLCLLVPEQASTSSCRWIFPMVFGGGLVGGDVINVEYHIGSQSAALVTSQESTKVYHCKGGELSQQKSAYHVSDGAFLAVLGDPVVCFADASFKQTQRVYLSCSSSLVLLDWVTAGRMALKELWQFKSYQNLIEVYVEGELVFRDNQLLSNTPFHSLQQAMKGYQVLGTCIVLGKDAEYLVTHLKQLYSHQYTIGEQLPTDLICSFSHVEARTRQTQMQGCYLRFLAASTSQAFKVVKEISGTLTELLGGDPYARKY